jgi:hypothetical protein
MIATNFSDRYQVNKFFQAGNKSGCFQVEADGFFRG